MPGFFQRLQRDGREQQANFRIIPAKRGHNGLKPAPAAPDKSSIQGWQSLHLFRSFTVNDFDIAHLKSPQIPADQLNPFRLTLDGINSTFPGRQRHLHGHRARARANICSPVVRSQGQLAHNQSPHFGLRHGDFASNKSGIRQARAHARIGHGIFHGEYRQRTRLRKAKLREQSTLNVLPAACLLSSALLQVHGRIQAQAQILTERRRTAAKTGGTKLGQ